MIKKPERVTVRDTHFVYRTNFRGERTEYNQNGYREFNVALPDDLAEEMIADGWNVKYTKPREEGDPAIPNIPVRINFNSEFPPRVWLINADSGKRNRLDDDTIGQLDFLSREEIEKVNIVLNPRYWESHDKSRSGIKAYCHSMQVYFQPDALEAEYEARYGTSESVEDDIPFD